MRAYIRAPDNASALHSVAIVVSRECTLQRRKSDYCVLFSLLFPDSFLREDEYFGYDIAKVVSIGSRMTVITDESHFDLRSPIQNFYAGQNIFITGGTGFLGKVLIEKLLRSCPDLVGIYILIRPKKGKDVHSRTEAIFDDLMFERLKKEAPKFRHRIVAVEGDCTLPGLGLSPVDRDLLLREISIVFHVAATVRFDEKLKQAVAINVSGTKEILELARCIHSLKAVIHVSTAYSNCNLREIDEKFYSPPITGDNIMRLVQSLNEEKLDTITPALLGDFPNTYTYTKCTAEQVIQQYGKDLPVGVFRPAIVISSYAEPVEGWIDNVGGATGALVGGGAGLLRTLNIDPNCAAELVPVDYAVNALIATAWDVANNKNHEAHPPIYNYHSSWNDSLTWGQYINLAMKFGKTMPSIRSMWCYSAIVAKNYYVYYILSFLLHILPAFIIDVGLFLTGQKTRMLKIYKKIHKYSTVTTYFSTNKWTFKNNNTRALWETLNDEDKKLFFFSMDQFDWNDYMKKCVLGIRQYIFKDELSTIPAAKKRMARLLIFHRIIKYTTIVLFTWLVYSAIALIPWIDSISVFTTSISESINVR